MRLPKKRDEVELKIDQLRLIKSGTGQQQFHPIHVGGISPASKILASGNEKIPVRSLLHDVVPGVD